MLAGKIVPIASRRSHLVLGRVPLVPSRLHPVIRQCRGFGSEQPSAVKSAEAVTAATTAAQTSTTGNPNPGGKQKGRWARRIGLGVTAFSGLLVGGCFVAAKLDEGMERTFVFWLEAFPLYAHYRYVQALNEWGYLDAVETDKEYNRLHDMYSPVTEALTYKLRGFYLKQAQLMSTRDDFVPKQYLEWCKKTQDQVPSQLAPGQARAIFKNAFGKEVDEVFEMWDDKPYASASIGQVHRARLKGGKEVVVKIQLPGVEKMFRADLTTTRNFCKLSMPHHVPAFDEIERQFLTEFDYVGEAKNLQEVYNNIMPVWGAHVQIPEPIMDYCSKEVLTMEFLPGKKLVDGLKDQYRVLAKSMNKTLEELEKDQKRKLETGELKLKSPEEEAKETAKIQRLFTIRDTWTNFWRFVYNWSPLRLVWGRKAYEWTSPMISLGSVLTLLNHVHAHEIFIDGAFNGDPHPGNILLMPDGRLGLVDYGQVKHMTLKDRLIYAKLILALAKDDKEEVARIQFEEIGTRTKKMDRHYAYLLTAFWNDRDSDEITGGRNIQEFMDWVQAQDPLVRANDEFIMAARVSVMMRGMGNAFGLRMRTAPMWKPYAEKLLQANGIAYS